MAHACGFNESNAVLGPPEGMTEDQCASLSICRSNIGDIPIVISCWKLTKEELEEINRTGRIWLTIMGHSMPPVIVSGIKPYDN